MKRIQALAILTLKEGIRDRALMGIFVIGILMLLATIIFTGVFGYDLGKVLVDLNLSTIAFSGLLLTFFVNVNLMAKDIDKRTIYCVLSKPISRNEYIIGKYLGLLALVIVSLALLTAFSSGVMALVKTTYPATYFKTFSWACYFQALGYQILMLAILNAVVIFFSSISTSSFLTFLSAIAVYIAGQTIEEVIRFFKNEAASEGVSSQVNQWVVVAAQYVFPNFSAFDIKTLAAHGKLLPAGHTLAVMGYGLIYTLLLLFVASLIFNKREFH